MPGGALREILAKFGFEIEDEKLHGLDEKISHLSEKFREFGEVVLGGVVGEKVHEFVEGQIEISSQLKHTSEILGIATDELQRFYFAANLGDASIETASTGIRFLNRNIAEAVSGNKEAAKTFADLKIDVKDAGGEARPTMEIVRELADKLKDTKSQAERTRIAMKLLSRGGAELLPMFQEGAEGLDEAAKAFQEFGGGMDKDFIQKAEEAEVATKKFRFALQVLKSRIATELLPGFTKIYNRLAKWTASFIALTKKTNILRTALLFFGGGAVVATLIKLGKVLKSIGFNPVLTIVILALYLLFDDLFTLMTGGKSVIGELIDKIFGVGSSQKVVEDLKAAWDDIVQVWDLSKEAVGGLAAAMGATLLTACYALITAGKLIGRVFIAAWDAMHGNITLAGDDLMDMKGDLKDFGTFFGKMNSFVAGGGSPAGEPVDPAAAVRQPMTMARLSPKGEIPISQTRQPTSQYSSPGGMNHRIEITNHISGVSDPKAAGEHAGRATKKAVDSRALRNAFSSMPGLTVRPTEISGLPQ